MEICGTVKSLYLRWWSVCRAEEEDAITRCLTEMLVTVTGFGSVWRRWFDNGDDPKRRPGAYFNTTGVKVRGTIHTRSKVVGHIWFSGTVAFDPDRTLGTLASVFECAEPCVREGQNKVLFKRMLSAPQQPDYLLVVVKAADIGHIDLSSRFWRSDGTLLVSLSESRDQQEAMLLMPPGSWLRTDRGMYKLRPFVAWPWSGRLHLEIPRRCLPV